MSSQNKEMLGICRERFAKMAEKDKQFEETLKRIEENHLPHLQAKIDKLIDRVNFRPPWYVVGLCSLVIGLLVYVLKG